MFKFAFSLVGLILFAAQLSGKFYQSASMPFPASSSHHTIQQIKFIGDSIKGGRKIARLSLDKRYDLTTVVDLPAPVFSAGLYSKAICPPILLYTSNIYAGIPVLTLMRGPPAIVSSCA